MKLNEIGWNNDPPRPLARDLRKGFSSSGNDRRIDKMIVYVCVCVCIWRELIIDLLSTLVKV